MIKEKNFQSIIVSDKNGIIVSSTEKNFEGKEFTTVGKPSYLTSNTPVVDRNNEGLLTISSPIMGFNERLGTLLITYRVLKSEYLSESN